MDASMSEITEMLNVPREAASCMMREFKWNKERLIDSYMNDSEGTLTKSGVLARVEGPKIKEGADSVDETFCGICCDNDYEPSEMYCMPCNHKFCKDCWEGYLLNKLQDGPVCVYANCPSADCKECVTEKEYADIVPDSLKKYNEYQLRSFVDLNKLTRWCPGVNCIKVAISKSGSGQVQCSCGHEFCIKCGEEPHAPILCDDLTKWNEKCHNESETANWILANTKKVSQVNAGFFFFAPIPSPFVAFDLRPIR